MKDVTWAEFPPTELTRTIPFVSLDPRRMPRPVGRWSERGTPGESEGAFEVLGKRRFHVAILGAIPLEIESLVRDMDSPEVSILAGQECFMDRIGAVSVLVGTTGLGKVNAAITTATLLERFQVDVVWSVGCAGAFGSGPLCIGDVLVADSVLCGDEGVLTERDIESCRCIGIPLVSRNGVDHYDAFPLSGSRVFEMVRAITPAGRYRITESGLEALPPEMSWEGDCFGSLAEGPFFQIAYGPSLTVGMVSGSPGTARKRFERYRALAENMEGSAVAQTCLRFGVPMLECRGMSNVAGVRDKSHWRLEPALDNCHGVLKTWLARIDEPRDGR